MKLIAVFLLLLIIGCAENKAEVGNQTLDFGSFSIVTPKGWTKIKAQGVDSYVGQIAIDNTDTIYFDLGWFSNNLEEAQPQIIERRMLRNMHLLDTSELIIVESSKEIDPKKFMKNNISWYTVDGRKAKIVFPKQSGIGTTGIYIDSLWQGRLDVDRFNMYGHNLKPGNEKLLIQALKTLRFHKRK